MAPRKQRAARLPSGSYGWKGRAVPFSKLPKSEQARFRSGWATKAAKTRSTERAIERPAPAAKVPSKERKQARDWINRRTEKVAQQVEHSRAKGKRGLPDPVSGAEVLRKLGPGAILAARKLQKAAHKAYGQAGHKPGGRAREIAQQIRDALGSQLAAAMPQLWWYH